MNDYLEVGMVALLILFSIAMLIFWIQCLIEAARLDSGSDKVVWVLILLFTGILGAIVFRLAGPQRKADDDSDEAFLRQMREEMERDAANRRPPIVLTAEEERVIEEMRRSYRGESKA